jgi:CheY-like chemotaxis protein
MTALSDCVAVIEDEPFIAELWSMHLENMGLTVCGIAATAESAIALAKEHRPSLVIMDMRLRGPGDGVDAALAIDQSVGSKIIFITGSREHETLTRMNTANHAAVLYKPVSDRQFKAAVLRALEKSEA